MIILKPDKFLNYWIVQSAIFASIIGQLVGLRLLVVIVFELELVTLVHDRQILDLKVRRIIKLKRCTSKN